MACKQGRMGGRYSRAVWKNKMHSVSRSVSRYDSAMEQKAIPLLSQQTESPTIPVLLSLTNAAHR
jgi:hypothetical protein